MAESGVLTYMCVLLDILKSPTPSLFLQETDSDQYPMLDRAAPEWAFAVA